MHGSWRYAKERGWLVRKLVDADAAAWCADGWEPNRWQLFAARLLGRFERWRAAWLCLFPPPVKPGYSPHGYTEFDWHIGVWLRFKGAVCLVLGLGSAGKRWHEGQEIVWFDLDGRSWSKVDVGWGVFENWFACLDEESEDCEHG